MVHENSQRDVCALLRLIALQTLLGLWPCHGPPLSRQAHIELAPPTTHLQPGHISSLCVTHHQSPNNGDPHHCQRHIFPHPSQGGTTLTLTLSPAPTVTPATWLPNSSIIMPMRSYVVSVFPNAMEREMTGQKMEDCSEFVVEFLRRHA